uniref:Integrase core domain containing protein n=1 Tax=Solanum tuberosum TaxID=4113 RepID=M0ZK04_SOLTU
MRVTMVEQTRTTQHIIDAFEFRNLTRPQTTPSAFQKNLDRLRAYVDTLATASSSTPLGPSPTEVGEKVLLALFGDVDTTRAARKRTHVDAGIGEGVEERERKQEKRALERHTLMHRGLHRRTPTSLASSSALRRHRYNAKKGGTSTGSSSRSGASSKYQLRDEPTDDTLSGDLIAVGKTQY